MPRNVIIKSTIHKGNVRKLQKLKVAGAPIFTYTHEPDDNEIHNGCKTMLYYVRGALCKHTIMSFPICQYTGEVVIFVVYSFLTSSFV